MQTETNIKASLIAYKQKNKFSDDAWESRGLIAPDIDLCKEMQLTVNEVIDNLLETIDSDNAAKSAKNILKNGLKLFDKIGFDTEEKEFIGDVFFELSNIVGINISSDLNKWLYGPLMNTLIKLSKLKSEKIIKTLKQPCINCGIELESHIMKQEKGIPDISWIIAKCKNCKELNLLSIGPDIKETKFGNYEWLGTLSKEDYNYDQGLIKIRQIKFEKNRFHY